MFINISWRCYETSQWMSELFISFFLSSFFFLFFFNISFVFSRKDRYYLIYVFLLNMISFIYSSRRFLSLFYLILWYMYMIEMMKFFLWKESMKFFCRNCNFINCYIVNVYVSIKNPLRILFFLSFFFLILIIIFIIMWIFFFFTILRDYYLI